MSSATSTERLPAKPALPPKAGNHGGQGSDEGFRISHFFILLSLIAATVAVMLARPATPEHLILISLTIGAAGLAAIAFYRTIAPLLDTRGEDAREPVSATLRADLEREKALTLRSIKELEFDRAMGKLSREDFDQMAGRLRARAMGIMKQLEAGSAAYREQVERDIAARMPNRAPDRAPDRKVRPTTDDLLGADRDARRPALHVRQCACGTANDADARFCKSCGAKLLETNA